MDWLAGSATESLSGAVAARAATDVVLPDGAGSAATTGGDPHCTDWDCAEAAIVNRIVNSSVFMGLPKGGLSSGSIQLWNVSMAEWDAPSMIGAQPPDIIIREKGSRYLFIVLCLWLERIWRAAIYHRNIAVHAEDKGAKINA